MAIKPTFKPEIARDNVNLPNTGSTNKLRPRATWRLTGFDKGDYFGVQEFNWLFDNNCDWVNYFEELTDEHETRLVDVESDITSINNAGYQTAVDVNALIVAALDDQYPIGSIVFNTSGANPNSYLGVGTWVQVAQGRFIVGQGTGTDANSNTRNYSTGNDSVGEYTHTMTESELVPHTHNLQGTNETNGEIDPLDDVGTALAGDIPANPANVAYTNQGYGASDQLVEDTGGGTAFNVAPPAFGMYVWSRNG